MGASAALWASKERVRIEPGRWLALSGARSVDYNLILCHGDPEEALLADGVDELTAARVPGIVMAAGAALGGVQQLVLRGWVCIGAMPFMIRELESANSFRVDDGVRQLSGEDVEAARRLVADVFDLSDKAALVALPADAAQTPGQAVWGAFDEDGRLASCVAAVTIEDIVVTWSLATARDARRRGHGARVMNAVLADAARGARASLLYAPVPAEAFYRSLGYHVLEHWQLWSSPRWVLASA
jgi:GNAT superfamily N-acetyltransferase